MLATSKVELADVMVGDWVETDRDEVGEVIGFVGPGMVEICVGRCIREMPRDRILRLIQNGA